MIDEKFQCCFCGETIASQGPDVGGLVYITNSDGPESKQHNQTLYCHANCFKQRLHPSAILYVLDLVGMDD